MQARTVMVLLMATCVLGMALVSLPMATAKTCRGLDGTECEGAQCGYVFEGPRNPHGLNLLCWSSDG